MVVIFFVISVELDKWLVWIVILSFFFIMFILWLFNCKFIEMLGWVCWNVVSVEERCKVEKDIGVLICNMFLVCVLSRLSCFFILLIFFKIWLVCSKYCWLVLVRWILWVVWLNKCMFKCFFSWVIYLFISWFDVLSLFVVCVKLFLLVIIIKVFSSVILFIFFIFVLLIIICC